MSQNILVYADWGDGDPRQVGELTADVIRGQEHFRFAYSEDWLEYADALQIDPELQLYAGDQHSEADKNFRAFLDSCPDRWGRLLIKRREAALAVQAGEKPRILFESDYLLGVHDTYRMGAMRFKSAVNGDFLDNNPVLAAPPVSSLREIEYAVAQLEHDHPLDDPDYLHWLNMLIAPGSSLGGARPKSCMVDTDGSLWIAKFPSRHDEHDTGAWEYVVHKLAINAGITMAKCRVARFSGHHHTFMTKRFDRQGSQRRHFTSALTQLGYYDGEDDASYLELAQFLTEHGSNTKADLEQLWRRIVFYIAVSNTDDHLRNHGFLFENRGWVLSPAYDINPVSPGTGLHLNITDNDNRLDLDLPMSVIEFFQLNRSRAEQIRMEVLTSVRNWGKVASNEGISRAEQQQMAAAFNV